MGYLAKRWGKYPDAVGDIPMQKGVTMSKPLKVGLIGTGGISRAHLLGYQEFPDKVKLTAVCDIREDAARQYAKDAGVEAVYTDAAEMLKDADIDAVDICTIHDQHLPQVVAAAEAGKHVLVEKAMGRTMAECRKMIAATDKAGITFMVAQDLRYSPSSRAVRRLIQEGELGTIRAARCDTIMNVTRILPPGHWMMDGERAGGGVLTTNTVHIIDLLRYFAGDVRRVTGVCKAVGPEMVNGAEDYACATLEFENGAIGTAFGIWSVSRSPVNIQYQLFGDDGALYSSPERPAIGADTDFRERIQALGEQVGPIMVSSPKRDEPGTEPVNRLGSFVRIEPLKEGLPSDISFVNEIVHFAECCRTGEEPISSGHDNLNTIGVVAGIYESARTGRAVDVADL